MHNGLKRIVVGVAACAVALCAQAPQPGPQPAPLKIVVLQGEGARHSIRSRHGVQTVIEVRDENGKPLPGAQVVFQLPAAGPGGTFPGGRLTQRTVTDARGQAATAGFAPNDQEGRFNLKVTATSGEASASIVVSQINALRTEVDAARRSKKPWIVLLLGGAAAGGVIAATRGGEGPGAGQPPTITLVPGPVQVGGPR